MQKGGGRCSLCGSPGTNITTCPLNQRAMYPNPNKHPLAMLPVASGNRISPTDRARQVERQGAAYWGAGSRQQAERQRVERQREERQRVERQHERIYRQRIERQLASYRRELQPGERQQAERQEAARQEAARQEAARQEAARQEAAARRQAEAEHQRLTVLEAPSMQDTQWQQMQDNQSQQWYQQFDERAAHTSTLINSYDNAVFDDIDGCTFMPASEPNSGMDFMIDTIREMEKVCRTDIAVITSCELDGTKQYHGSLITRFYEPLRRIPREKTMHWTQGDGVTMMPLKYFASVVSNKFLIYDKVKIRLIGNPATDIGGVSRSVYSKAGEYIKSICVKEGDRYYFGTRMPKDSYDIIVGCIIAALDKGFVLGVPLSYSILYCINKNTVPSISDIGLPTLMALMKMDNPEELQRLITTISTQQGVESAAPYHKYSETVLPKGVDGEAIDVTMDRRYEWLKRIIYHTLFGRQKKHLNKLLQSGKWVKARVANLDGTIVAMRNCQLGELSMALGSVLTREAMTALKIITQYLPPSATTLQYIRDYINANEDKWALFLRFVTGSTDPNVTIKVDNKAGGLPSSSTCFNALHIRNYLDYDEFTREMDMALTSADDMSLS
jgi:hypothetical protein